MISMNQAAKDLNLSPHMIRHWVDQMRIPTIRKGEETLIVEDNFSKLRRIQNQQKSAEGPQEEALLSSRMIQFFQNQLQRKDKQIEFLQEMLQREVQARTTLESELEHIKAHHLTMRKISLGEELSSTEWFENCEEQMNENQRQYELIANML